MTPCTITLLQEGIEVLQAAALLPKALVLFPRATKLLMLQAAGAAHLMSRAVALFEQAVLMYNCTSEGYVVISASGMLHSRVVAASNDKGSGIILLQLATLLLLQVAVLSLLWVIALLQRQYCMLLLQAAVV